MLGETQSVSTAIRPNFSTEADYSRQPFIMAWELTRACNLACVHCRAEAQLRRHPGELTTAEAFHLLDDIATFDVPPTVILTGGDPMRRRDLIPIIEHASSRGIRTALTPAGTPIASPERLTAARDAGLSLIAVSLDGPDAISHDAFRQVRGSFLWSMGIIQTAHALGLRLQLHTTLSKRTLEFLPEMADLADELGAAVWAVFCLVPTGRAQFEDEITAEEYEQVFEWLVERSERARWQLKLTEGYHYRRVQARLAGGFPAGGPLGGAGAGRAPKPVNAGNGFCFISHLGDVAPSGFLPIYVGNVRESSIVDLYRNDPVFRSLRDPDQLKGKCGVCRFRAICGGSRSRAYAHTGDYLESDPACAYQPEPVEAGLIPSGVL